MIEYNDSAVVSTGLMKKTVTAMCAAMTKKFNDIGGASQQGIKMTLDVERVQGVGVDDKWAVGYKITVNDDQTSMFDGEGK